MSAASGEQRERVSRGKEWKNENQWRKKEMEEEEGVSGAGELSMKGKKVMFFCFVFLVFLFLHAAYSNIPLVFFFFGLIHFP
jgi:hypothetical protein